MTDEHPRPPTPYTGADADLLKHNYEYLNDLYKRGCFEDEIDEAKFTFFFEDKRKHGAARESDSAPARRASAKSPTPMKLAADDLNALAEQIEKAEPDRPQDLTVLIMRVRVLSYEIDDYFLDVPPTKADYFKGKAAAVGELLKSFGGTESPGGADPLVAYASEHFPSVRDPALQRELVQQLVLVTLSGVNQMYRDHHDDSYTEALPLAENLRRYIEHGLPKLSSPEHVSTGLLGLTLYMLGRLKFSLGTYAAADRDFIASAECYANRVHEKEALRRQDLLTQEQYESTRLLTLRRSALVSAFGSGFLSLITSDLPSALKSIALARGIVKQNSGLVNSAYTDLLYCAVKRAQHSSDLKVLCSVRRTLRRCLSVFRAYVPDRHYEHRAAIELALVHHYLARANSRQAKRSYAVAEAYLTSAVEFAERVEEQPRGETAAPGADPPRPRNMRLLAEALTIKSHIVRHCSPESMERVTEAVDLANRAVLIAEDSHLYTSEALIALGSAHASMADLIKDDVPALKKELSKARVNFLNALRFNEGANARISAVCFIRLGQLSLLDKETLAEALHWHNKWLDIKGKVHHEFCHQMGRELEEAVKWLGGTNYLLIDPEESLDRNHWQEQLDDFLIRQALNRVAEQMREHRRDVEKAGGAAATPEDEDVYRKWMVDFATKEMGFHRNRAYEWVDKHKLNARLKELLRS
jgi:hypothetical protein